MSGILERVYRSCLSDGGIDLFGQLRMLDDFSLCVDILYFMCLHVEMGTNTVDAETRCNNTVIVI
jgi:hypothetical protein